MFESNNYNCKMCSFCVILFLVVAITAHASNSQGDDPLYFWKLFSKLTNK